MNLKIVSIPIWCDLKNIFQNIKALSAAVSIPIWCDLKGVVEYFKLYETQVSIPIWCDLKIQYLCLLLLLYGGFNSNLVRFKAHCLLYRHSVYCCFNSNLVRFKGINFRKVEKK